MYKVSLNKSWVGTHYQTEIGPNRKKSSQSSGWIKEDYCRDVVEFGDVLGMRGFFSHAVICVIWWTQILLMKFLTEKPLKMAVILFGRGIK